MSLLAPRIRMVEVLQRAASTTIELPVYRDRALQLPTAGTVTLYDNSGSVVFTSAVSIIGSIAQYAVLGSDVPETLSLGEGYKIEWLLTIATVEYTFNQPAAIARSRLYPVISDYDLEAQYSDIANIRPAALTSYQNYIDEGWYQLLERLRQMGNIEYLIIDSQSLRMPLIDLVCYLIFKDMDSSGLGEGRYLDLATEHRKNYEGGIKRLNFRYDLDHSGKMDDPNKRRAAQPVFYTSAPPTTFNYRRY
jgi:hypothetical protein